MEDETNSNQQLRKKSKRFGILAALLFFLAALFSRVDFSFLMIFGLGGIYCAFLWGYFSYQAVPKKKTFEYSNAGPSSWANPSRMNSLPSGRLGFVMVVGGMIFIFLIAVFIFTSNSSSEEPTTEIQLSEDSPEAENYSTILKNDPDNIDALTNAGNSFYENGSYDSALYYYDRVLRLDASNSAALYNKSLVRYNQKDFAGAAELSLRCVELNPSNTDALMLLGDCYESQNNLDLAFTHYSKAYELGARTPGLSNMLAYLYDTKGNTSKAISFYKETLEQDSSRADVYVRLAELEPTKKAWYEQKAAEWKAK